MWARAIIFGIELVGFAVFCVIATIKFYMQDVCKRKREDAVSNLRFNITYFVINYGAILSLFICSFSSFVFLSYSKLILISVSVLISFIFIMLFVFKKPLPGAQSVIYILVLCFSLIYFSFAITGEVIIENKIIVSEQTQTDIIKPAIISENQIGYTADMEGNIKTYIFYYQGDNGVWEYEELKASETQVEKIDTDTYIEKTITTTSYCKQEKKPREEDYITTEEKKSMLYMLI